MQAENGYTRHSLLHCEVDLMKGKQREEQVIHEEHCIYMEYIVHGSKN